MLLLLKMCSSLQFVELLQGFGSGGAGVFIINNIYKVIYSVCE